MVRKRVLVDATPLLSESGARGIGRYVYDLLFGLEEIRAEHGNLDLYALTGMTGVGRPQICGDLAAAAARLYGERSTVSNARARWFRRLAGARAFAQFNPDLVHLSEVHGTPLAPFGPWIATCHDLIPLRYPRQYLGYRLPFAFVQAMWRFHRPTRVVANSHRSAADVVRLLKVPASRVDVAQTGVSFDFWQGPECPKACEKFESGAFGTKPFAIYVGGSDYRKNVAGMFKALKRARKQVDMELYWAGKLSRRNAAKVAAAAEAHGLTEHVRFLGFIPDPELLTLYRNARAMLFISRIEGFGLPVAEAMVAGCPCIVAHGSGTDELVGESGVRVDADDTHATADALVRLVRDDAEYKRRADAGKEQLRSHTRRRMAEDYIKSYRKALGI